MIRRVLLLLCVGVALFPVGAVAAQPQFSMMEIESELMCPTCQSRLDMSHSPAADRIRAFVEAKRVQGWSKEQVKAALVADFGPSVLAAPPVAGFGLVAWLMPALVVIGGIALVVGLALAWRRRRSGTRSGAATIIEPGLDARVDQELQRFSDEQR